MTQHEATFALAQQMYWETLSRNLKRSTHRYKKYQPAYEALIFDADTNEQRYREMCKSIPQSMIPASLDARSRAAYQAAKDADRARTSKTPYRELDREYTQA